MRLNQLGLSDRDVAESVTLILAQRLLRMLCDHCKVPAGTPIASNLHQAADDCFQANLSGCKYCLQGYWGRTGVFELCQPESLGEEFPNNRRGKENTHDLRNMALRCYLAGKTSLEEVNRVVPAASGSGAR